MDKKTERAQAKYLCDKANELFESYRELFPQNREFHVDMFLRNGQTKIQIYNNYGKKNNEYPLAYVLDGTSMKDLHDIAEPKEMWGKCHECGYEFKESESKEVRYTVFGKYQETAFHCPRCNALVEDWEYPTLEFVNE